MPFLCKTNPYNQNENFNFPIWFLKWWDLYSPNLDILPQKVKEGCDEFQTNFNNLNHGSFPMLTQFFSKFGLPWCYKWKY